MRDEEVARLLRDQAFVPDEQPGAAEQPLLLLLIQVRRNEDLAADDAGCGSIIWSMACIASTPPTCAVRDGRPINVPQSRRL